VNYGVDRSALAFAVHIKGIMRTRAKKSSAGRSRNAKARRRKRIGAVRAVAKPKTRAEALKWAENLGFEALNQVRGGAGSTEDVGSGRTHLGGVSVAGCCPWGSPSKFTKLPQWLKPGQKGPAQPLPPLQPFKRTSIA
jgi:hypothetical protein